jgi:hypothetical protein
MPSSLHQRLLAFAVTASLPVLTAAQLPMQGRYSTEPIRDPIFEPARVVVETTAVNNWLNGNYRRLSPQQMKGPREHLYYLIDSRIKETFGRTGKVMPSDDDVVLELLFSWAERLGAYGGSLVYNRLRAPTSSEMPSLLHPPTGISIRMDGDLLEVKSATGHWTVEFPYYFMIWTIGDVDATNGLRTQLLALSTGTARDKSAVGHSQATLLLVFSPRADSNRFLASWKEQLGIPALAEEKALGVRQLRSQYHFDPQSNLHKEIVSWTEKQGPFAVVYLGLDGTYQWNRPHFIDFLRAVRIQ